MHCLVTKEGNLWLGLDKRPRLFSDLSEADAYVQELNLNNLHHHLTAHIYNEEDHLWKIREADKLNSGQYKLTGWEKESWYTSNPLVALHFIHVAEKDAGKVAYTVDPKKGKEDRQTVTSPHKYLAKFFPALRNAKDIGDRFLDTHVPVEIKFCETPEEAERVYKDGPASCMSGDSSRFSSTKGRHPAATFVSEEMSLAYLESGKRVLARAVVDRARKRFYSTYGDGHVKLQAGLKQLGYEYRNLEGAKLGWVETVPDKQILIPYLDCCSTVKIDPKGKQMWIGTPTKQEREEGMLASGHGCHVYNLK